MIPLVAFERELELVRDRVITVAEEEGLTYGEEFGVGTMIELPRACLIAGRIAQYADFFSFGTNDLTQAGMGFSRDDIEKGIIPRYVEEKIVDSSPFATLDELGVGELIEIAVERGRDARPDLELGICGEHGGDPDSIRFFHAAGLDYVSCSPFRLPIARVAAAQAAIASPRKKSAHDGLN
jgi:pyruvate,orthophosphate dikinase